MISGRIGFVAGMVGLGLTGCRIDHHRHNQQHQHSSAHGNSVTDAVEAAPESPRRRYRLLALLKGTTL